MNTAAFAPSHGLTANVGSFTQRKHVCSARSSAVSLQPRSSVSMTWAAAAEERARADIALLQHQASSLGDIASKTAAAVLLAGALSLSSATPAFADVPTSAAPASYLFDDAEVIQKGSGELFAKAMGAVETNTGLKVRFVMAKSLPYNETPDEYAAELYSAWNLGKDEVLFVASPKLARAGVAIGSNASKVLSYEIAESICNETYTLKAGTESYGAAVLDVSNRLIPVLNGDTDPGAPDLSAKEIVQNYKTKNETSKDRSKYIIVVVVVLLVSFIAPMLQTYWYIKDD